MTVRELYMALDKMIPASLSCEWDNDGLMCCPDSSREASRVLIALDPTIETVKQAIEGKYDAIITHHPLIFKGIKAIDDANMQTLKLMCLLEADIAVMSFHTRLDALEGGVNDSFASLLGLSAVEPLEHGGEKIGRIDAAGEEGLLVGQLGIPAFLVGDLLYYLYELIRPLVNGL